MKNKIWIASLMAIIIMTMNSCALFNNKTKPVILTQTAYRGIITNLSDEEYKFKIFGPELKIYLLKPGEKKTDYLQEGKYICTIYQGNNRVDLQSFEIDSRIPVEYYWTISK